MLLASSNQRRGVATWIENGDGKLDKCSLVDITMSYFLDRRQGVVHWMRQRRLSCMTRRVLTVPHCNAIMFSIVFCAAYLH